MESLKDLIIAVKADVDAAIKDFGRVTRELNNVVKQAEKLGQTVSNIGSQLTKSLTLPLAGAAAVGLSFFGDFEASMNKVSALGDITGKDLQSLTDQAKQLGASTQFSAKQAADGMKELAAAGFQTNQIMSSIPGVLSLAAAGELDLARAAEVSVNIMGAYGLAAAQSAHVSDVLAKAAASGSLSVEDLGFSFKYVGPVAKSAGLSLETTAAALALLSNAGIKGEASGTALRGILASLIDPSKEGAKVLDALGVSVKDSTGKLLPFAQILDTLKAKGISQAQTFQLVGRESASAFQVLMNQGATALNGMANDLVNSEGAAKKMADTMNSGLNGALERAKSSAEGLALSLGQQLAPYAIKVLTVLDDLAGKASLMVDRFQSLPEPVKNTAVAVGALLAVVGPALVALGALGSAGSLITGGLASITGALKLVSTTLGFAGVSIGGVSVAFLGWAAAIAAAVAALAAVGVWVYNHWAQIVGTLKQAWEGFGEFFGAVLDKMNDPITGFLKFVVAHWSTIKAVTVATFTYVADFVERIFDGLKNLIGSALSWIATKAKTIADALIEMKVPGAEKLLTLRKTWDDLAKTVTETGKSVAATNQALVKSPGLAAPAAVSPGATQHVGKASHKKTKEEFDLGAAVGPLAVYNAMIDDIRGRASKLVRQLATDLLEAKKPVSEFGAGFEQLGKITDGLAPKLDSIHFPLAEITVAMTDFGQAVERMGIKTTASLKANAEQAEKDFHTIADGIGTVDEIAQAYVKWTESVIALKRARGEDVNALEADLKRAQEKLDGKAHGAATKAKQPLQEVSTILTNLNQDIAGAIVNWQGFGNTALAVLKNIGKAIISDILSQLVFTEDRMKAITNTLGSLLGKMPGLDNVFGKATKTITDSATNAAGAVASTAKNTVGSVGKVASSALSSAVGMATGIVSAVSSVIGNFQMAGIGKDLGRVEVTTRGILNQLISIQGSLNQYLPPIPVISSQLAAIINNGLGVYSPEQTEVRARILGNTIASGGSGVGVTVNGNVYGGPAGLSQLAAELITVMRRQGASI